MSSYAGQNLFGSGPHAFRFGPWQRSVQRRGFAGVNGELVLDLGLRSRQIFQTGRLQADSASGLNGLLDAINARGDGAEHVLVDNHVFLGFFIKFYFDSICICIINHSSMSCFNRSFHSISNFFFHSGSDHW